MALLALSSSCLLLLPRLLNRQCFDIVSHNFGASDQAPRSAYHFQRTQRPQRPCLLP